RSVLPPAGQQPVIGAPRPTLPQMGALPALPSFQHHPEAAITVAPATEPVLPETYVVRHRETLASVAGRFRLVPSLLAASNHLEPTARLRKGTRVKLPQSLVVTYKGQPVTADVASVMMGSTAVTPFRFLFQAQGGSVVWDAEHQQVLASDATREVTL